MSESNTISAGGGGNSTNSPNQKQQQSNNTNITSFISGISHPEHLYDAAASLQHARQDGFDYVVTALPDTVLQPQSLSSTTNTSSTTARKSNSKITTRTDVTRLESKWWSTSIVGMVVDPPRFCKAGRKHHGSAAAAGLEGENLLEALTCTTSSTNSSSSSSAVAIRKEEANKVFWGMMEWASHMNIPAVILPSVPLMEHVGDELASTRSSSSATKKKRGGSSSISSGSKQGELISINSSEEEDIFATRSDDDNNNDHGGHQKKRGRTTHDDEPINKKISINNPSAKEYARLLTQLATSSICTTSHVQLWIRVPLTLPDLQAFQLLLARCDHSSSVGCILVINTKIADEIKPSILQALHIFLGAANVKAISWDISIFLKNKRGYPTLSKNHQCIFNLLLGRLGRTLRTLIEGSLHSLSTLDNTTAIQLGGATHRLNHLKYLRHLRSRPALTSKLDGEEAILETPYLDNLQSPLQPLGDHLEYQTYETFEKDPVKYRRYGEAIELALEDGMYGMFEGEEEEGEGEHGNKFEYLGSKRTTLGQLRRLNDDEEYGYGNDEDDDEEEEGYPHTVVKVDIYQVTILVVGAGRGPLVMEAIGAVSRVSAKLLRATRRNRRRKALHAKLIAIEKNPSAVLYLQSLKANDPSWNGGHDYDDGYNKHKVSNSEGDKNVVDVVPGTSNVTVIGCDMREAKSHPMLQDMISNPKSKGADIVVSELLGSFGDNELSPECLDGVQQCGILKEGCVSVPQSYTAFIAPVSSARLHSEAKTQSHLPLNTNEGPASPHVGMQRALETPYVVRSHAASQTHDEQPCWTFAHPHPSIRKEEEEEVEAMDTTTSDKDDNYNHSAKAAECVNNDRHAHLSFQCDPTHAAGSGCGYGAVDLELASMVSSPSAAAAAAADNNTDTTVTIHGFMGSFHSVLYESPRAKSSSSRIVDKMRNGYDSAGEEERSSVISIAPHSFSVGMFSWFPLYFPLKEPLRIPPGATVNCSIWRRSDDKRVWYEWCAEVVQEDHGEVGEVVWGTSSIHNPGGRSYHVNK
ncbi:hypothetical protein ACHAXR_010029 [Thalassiosira sp. AJA248-18]